MLFNSYTFILLFLPLTAAFYFLLHKYLPAMWPRLFLLLASLSFISFWNVSFALILILSVLFNFACGSILSAQFRKNAAGKKPVFIAAVTANILFLGFFKYCNFFLDNINAVFSSHIGALHI